MVTRPHRACLVLLALGVMSAGLVWRLVPMGLPVFWLRHGGAVLWGAMILCLVAAARPARFSLAACVLTASFIAIGSEVFRLYHEPSLDLFRHTLTGALLLGSVFSTLNMVDYEIGIGVAAFALSFTPYVTPAVDPSARATTRSR